MRNALTISIIVVLALATTMLSVWGQNPVNRYVPTQPEPVIRRLPRVAMQDDRPADAIGDAVQELKDAVSRSPAATAEPKLPEDELSFDNGNYAEEASPSDIRVPNLGDEPDEKLDELTLDEPTNEDAFRSSVDETLPQTHADIQEPIGPTRPQLPEHGEQASFWWEELVQHRLRPGNDSVYVDVSTLITATLSHSLKIRAVSQTAAIRAEDIIRAEAEFDPTAFMEAKFVDTTDPVGNTLVTGGPSRLNDHHFTYDAGFRKKTTTGASLELSQQLGHQNNNSVFFLPQNQGNARLSLSYTQPLLNGAGTPYNTSFVVLADINTQIAKGDYFVELQDQLLEVTHAYWQLYMERAIMLQKQRHLQRAEEILAELRGRLEIDALRSQIVRAEAAVASRRAELARSNSMVRNVESQIRALVNSPELSLQRSPEMIPRELPFRQLFPVDLHAAIQTAIRHRPEIDQATKRINAASVRLNMSRNELLPSLSLILESYLSGLEGRSRVGRAFTEQFDTGAPSYSIGLQLESPIWNRAASARLRQREIELNQLSTEFQSTIENLSSEVEIAVREVTATYQEVNAKFAAMAATVAELKYLRERWELLPGDDRAASLLLEDILNSQERLMDEETSLVRAQVGYVRALANLKRATGTLMGYEALPRGPIARRATPALPPTTQQPMLQPAPQFSPNIPTGQSLPPNGPSLGDRTAQRPEAVDFPIQSTILVNRYQPEPTSDKEAVNNIGQPTTHNVSLRRLPEVDAPGTED